MRLQRFPFEMMLAVRFHRTFGFTELVSYSKKKHAVGLACVYNVSRYLAPLVCVFFIHLNGPTIPWPFASETSALYSALLFPSIFRFNLELFTLKV